MRLYETEIFGRIPSNTPKVTWEVKDTDPAARDGAALMKQVVGTVGSGDAALHIKVTVYTPAKAPGPVPVILLANFGGGATPARVRAAAYSSATRPLRRRSSRAAGATPWSAIRIFNPIRRTR